METRKKAIQKVTGNKTITNEVGGKADVLAVVAKSANKTKELVLA